MEARLLIHGSREQLRELAGDARFAEAEAAFARFSRTGAVRDASAFARGCFEIARELVQRELPPETRGEALRSAVGKILDAALGATSGRAPGWLAWALAYELRELAAARGVTVTRLRPPRGPRTPEAARATLSTDDTLTLACEILRVAGSTTSLAEIRQVLGLSAAEAAALFGVTRQAVEQWQQTGVPADRRAGVERVRDVAAVLYDELLPERIPQVVRTPARGLTGRTILDVLAEPDGPAQVRAYLSRLYAFEAP